MRGAGGTPGGMGVFFLGLAMVVVGGIGTAEGAVVGTLIVVLFDKVLIGLGPFRVLDKKSMIAHSRDILSGLEKNPFVADNRFSDVFFGTNQSYMVIGNFTIPDGYQFEELPKNIKMIMPDTSVTILRRGNVFENRLMTKVELDFNRPIYAATQYPELQEFYKQLFDLLNEQYVIRKKK